MAIARLRGRGHKITALSTTDRARPPLAGIRALGSYRDGMRHHAISDRPDSRVVEFASAFADHGL
jgi:hypothetical protein